MGDAHALAARHLIARTHDVPPCAQLDLCRPAQRPAAARATSTGDGRERPDLLRQRHRSLRAHAVERDRARPGSARRGCSAATGSPARPRAAPAVRRSDRTARHWRHACRTGCCRCRDAIGVERVFHHVMARRADRVHEQLAGEFRQAEALAHRAAVDGKTARPRLEFPAAKSPAPCPPHRTAAARAGSRRRRSRPSSSPTPAAWTARRRRGRRRNSSRSSACRDSAPGWSAVSAGSFASSSVTTSAPGGTRSAMRAAMRAASNAATSTVRAPLAGRSVNGRAISPARSVPTAVTSCT